MQIPKQLQNPNFRFVKLQGKRPLEKNWPKTYNYSFNSNEILNHPNNLGIVCGFGNLAILDCDTEELGKIAQNKLPATFTVRTGSGGLHLYFLISDLDKKYILKKDEKHHGELQFIGTQCVIPGSIHPDTKKKYQILSDKKIAEISKDKILDVLSDFLEPSHKDESSKKDDSKKTYHRTPELQNYLSKIRKKGINLKYLAEKFGYNYQENTLLKCLLPQSDGEPHESISEKNFMFYPNNDWTCYHCKKGGDEISFVCEHYKKGWREAVRDLENFSGIKYFSEGNLKQMKETTRIVSDFKRVGCSRQYVEDELKNLWEKGEDVLSPQNCEKLLNSAFGPKRKESDNGFCDVQDFLENDPLPLQWRVESILQEGGITLLAGKPKSFKSFFAEYLGLKTCSGQDVFGLNTKKSRILYIDQENNSNLHHRRIKSLQNGDEINNIKNFKLWTTSGLRLDDEDGFQPILDQIIDYKPEMVIIDSLVAFLQNDENDSLSVRKFFENIKPLAHEKGISFLILHHKNKGVYTSKNKENSIRGSSDLIASPDLIFSIETKWDGGDKFFELSEFMSRNESHFKNFSFEVKSFKLTDGEHEMLGFNRAIQLQKKVEPENKDDLRDSIFEFFKQKGEIGLKTSEIRDFFHLKSATCTRYLNQFQRENLIIKIKNGRYKIKSNEQFVSEVNQNE